MRRGVGLTVGKEKFVDAHAKHSCTCFIVLNLGPMLGPSLDIGSIEDWEVKIRGICVSMTTGPKL